MTGITTESRPDRVALGVTLIVSAVFLMSIQEALIKFFSTDLSLWQLFTLRGLFAMPLLVGIAIVQNQQRTIWRDAVQKWSVLRAIFMTLQFIASYAALPLLSLSTIAAGVYTAPVFVALLSAYAIGEPVGVRGWIAVAVGFAGVLIILKPGTDAFTFWAVLPVVGGFLYALTNVTTRSKCQRIPLPALALSLNLALLLAGILFSVVMLWWAPAVPLVNGYPFLFGTWSTVGGGEWGVVAILAVLLVAIQLSLAGAYKSAPPSTVATFDYMYLVFVVAWDFLIFSDPPGGATIVGILMIAFAGLLVLRKS